MKSDEIKKTTLRQAILEKKLVEFQYADGTKVLEPHMVAFNRTGHILLQGWFVRGDSRFGEQGWQEYMLAGISALKILPEAFPHPRFGYNPNDESKFVAIHCCL
ncbi:MAG: WYL domain-containing protein [Kiritimatiellales bacterium]|nr:WYL domain-containing protein [Kiritimatiellales bacterium]